MSVPELVTNHTFMFYGAVFYQPVVACQLSIDMLGHVYYATPLNTVKLQTI